MMGHEAFACLISIPSFGLSASSIVPFLKFPRLPTDDCNRLEASEMPNPFTLKVAPVG